MSDFTLPPVENTDKSGLLAIGGELSARSILYAHGQGIFPWPIGEYFHIPWFSPNPRGVIFTNNFHIPKSLNKILRQKKFNITFNQQFESVIQHCQQVKRKGQNCTWITEKMIQACRDLHYQKHAYSVEVLQGEKLVGGMYGVNIGLSFSGESMFFLERDASKVALVTLLFRLKEIGCPFLDTQIITSITQSLGAREIPRKIFIEETKKLVLKKSVNL